MEHSRPTNGSWSREGDQDLSVTRGSPMNSLSRAKRDPHARRLLVDETERSLEPTRRHAAQALRHALAPGAAIVAAPGEEQSNTPAER